MKRPWRRRLIIALLLVTVGAAIRYGLASPFVAARVAAKLEELYGGPVHVGGARIGLRKTILTDVALFESAESSVPWLTVHQLEANLSLSDIITGATPSRIVLDGVVATLRFDGEGRLLTRWPQGKSSKTGPPAVLPEIDLANGKVDLIGPGVRALTIEDIVASLKPNAARYTLDATGRTKAAGDWAADGWFDLKGSQLAVTARSQGVVAVTQPLLESLPFVPPATWREVQTEGSTPVVVTLANDWSKRQQSYRVELQPVKANIHLAAIDLAASGVAGRIEIADGKVILGGLAGQAYGGTLGLDGVVDFTQKGVHVDLTQLAVDGADIRQLPARWSVPSQLDGTLFGTCRLGIVANDGKLKVDGRGAAEVRQARIAGQATSGPIRLALQENQGATILRVDLRLPPTELSSLVCSLGTQMPAECDGMMALEVAASLPLDTITDARTYQVDGRVELSECHVAGLEVEPLQIPLHCVKGEIKVDDFRVHCKKGGDLLVRGTVCLSEPFAYSAHLESTAIDLSQAQQLPATLHLPFAINGRLGGTADVQGTGRPFVCNTAGSATFGDAQVFDWKIDAAQVQWHSDADHVVIDALQAEAFGGHLAGTAELPLHARAAGSAQLEAQNFDVARINGVFLSSGEYAPGKPISRAFWPDVAGRISGMAHAVLSAPSLDHGRELDVDVNLQSDSIVVDNIAAHRISAALHLSRGLLAYRMDGRMLGGGFGLQGDVAWAGPGSPFDPQAGRLILHGIDVARLRELQNAIPVIGIVDANLEYHFERDPVSKSYGPVASGRFFITNPGFNNRVLCSQLEGGLQMNRQELHVPEVTATLAQGSVTGKMSINLKDAERSWFELDLDGAELSDLLEPWPALASEAQGDVDIRVRGKLGRECSGTADFVLQRGKVLGVEVAEWRAPVRWTLRHNEGEGGELEVHDSNAQIAQGRVTVQANASWNSGVRLDGQIQFVDVDLRQAFAGAKLGNGRATGRITFGSERLQSAEDLQGTIRATIHHTQAMQFPVLRQVAPLLGQSTAATFQSGEFQARLSRGVVHVEKLALQEGPIQLFAEGNFTLQGRVNLDMTANTGRFGSTMTKLGWQIPLAGPIARDLLARATTALSPQLVHIHVRGTVHEPTIQVVPLPLLTERALRYFAGGS